MSFESVYSVTLPYPIEEVFKRLRSYDPARMEALERLAPAVATYKVVKSDTVLVKHVSIDPVVCRDLPAVPEDTKPAKEGEHLCTRTYLHVTQTFDFLGGLSYSEVPIEGMQTIDEVHNVVLVETTASSGVTVKVWKTRKFKEVVGKDGKKATEVHEIIKGTCPWIMKVIIGAETRRSHQHNMNKYPELFKDYEAAE